MRGNIKYCDLPKDENTRDFVCHAYDLVRSLRGMVYETKENLDGTPRSWDTDEAFITALYGLLKNKS